ncbi:MAG: ParB/RepB/Spo0J family partition protein [Acholeplasmatales bacterium]|nr:MAG: ParB/RepB/Spo0J family partition protein [Acholeplasmatales bacterium]
MLLSKGKLGRRIIDLIEENKIIIADHEEIQEISIDSIHPNPNQPRVNFDSGALKQLAESIKQHGVIQPVILKPSPNGYTLVAGERRVRASKIAGKSTVPAIVRDYNAVYLTELAILENLQREDLSPIEEAVAYEKAIKNLQLTQAELAKKIGKSRSHITNMIGLLTLPIHVIEEVNNGRITMGHARVLSKIEDDGLIEILANKVVKDGMSVRKLEDLARREKSKALKRSKKNTDGQDMVESIAFSNLTNQLKQFFGEDIDVSIRQKEVVIKFRSVKDFRKYQD